MNLKSGFALSLLILFSGFVFANPLDSIGVTKVNDKLHVRYMVSPGETIYGISSKYDVAVSDLIELNPELENGLKVGQVINIPYNPQTVRSEKKDENLVIHKVQQGETFFGIAKKYNISVGDLMKMNNMELKAGQEIIVGHKDQPKTAPADNVNIVETQKQTPVETKVNKPVNADSKANNQNNSSAEVTKAVVEVTKSIEAYPYDPSRKQVLVIPFDPYLYFSDADDEIAAKSNLPRTKVRQVFRKRLNALLDAPAYETIHLLGGKAKDSLTDLNKIYGMVTYNYQQAVESPFYKETESKPVEVKKNKTWLEKQKDKISNPNEKKYDIPKDNGSYFGVVIRNPEFFNYFNTKYSIDYYIFVSQFEVKTNYENCLDRAALNYERTFTTHYSIFDSSGKQISGNKFKTHYNSNSNNVNQIVSDNMEKIANRILSDLPPPNK